MNVSKPPFGLKYPIFQAPTASIAGPELCAAVASAGAMGAMGLTWTDPERAAEFVKSVRSQTDGLFYVNFALAFPPVGLDSVLDAGAPFVTFSWGDPAPHVQRVRSAKARFGVQITNAENAKRAIDLGADFVICQGIEAGGHVQSNRPLRQLLEEVLPVAGATPVIAAGGIATGEDIARVLMVGATGALLGTRFVATQESRAHELYKGQLLASDDTALTMCFDGGWPGTMQRVLRNRTLNNWEAMGSPPKGQRPGECDVVGKYSDGDDIFRYDDAAPQQGFTGDILDMCLYAGQGCGSIHDLPSARELVPRLWEEALAAMSSS